MRVTRYRRFRSQVSWHGYPDMNTIASALWASEIQSSHQTSSKVSIYCSAANLRLDVPVRSVINPPYLHARDTKTGELGYKKIILINAFSAIQLLEDMQNALGIRRRYYAELARSCNGSDSDNEC